MKNKKDGNLNRQDVYQRRIGEFQTQINKLKKVDKVAVTIKLLLILFSLSYLYKFLRDFKPTPLLGFSIVFILFIGAAVFHESQLKKIKNLNLLKTINEDEIKALNHQFINVDTGQEYINPNHPYTTDLDIFGPKSLYHYLNRTATIFGKQTLAQYLSKPSKPDIIGARQGAISELSEKLDFRHNLQKHGAFIIDTSKNRRHLKQMLDEPEVIADKKSFILLIHVFPVLTIALIVLSFFGLPWQLAAGLFLFQLIINTTKTKKIAKIYTLSESSAKTLGAYARIINEIEHGDFNTPYLIKKKGTFTMRSQNASSYIKKLSLYIQNLELRHSSIHFILNNILFWDLNTLYRIEKWRRETRDSIESWFHSIGEFETLSSLANLSFNNPDWTIPKIIVDRFNLEAESMGHPLIPNRERICNDFQMKNKTHIHIITGPNMSGKSTFLKTIGINLVLAVAGGPVCATSFALSPLQLVASMNAADSLDQHMSLFYAELNRLKMILDTILTGIPVFFIIDEMLKGTNALDRQKGAIALIKQLIKEQANGIVATHDLELTKLSRIYAKNLSNFHFDGQIKNEKLYFDYKLKKGICRSFNALVLMKKMGIQIEDP